MEEGTRGVCCVGEGVKGRTTEGKKGGRNLQCTQQLWEIFRSQQARETARLAKEGKEVEKEEKRRRRRGSERVEGAREGKRRLTGPGNGER